jgi:nitroreductase
MLAPRPASRSRLYFVQTVPTLPPSRLTSSAGGSRAPLVIAVVSRAGPHVKIPEWEQQLSAGASAMSLVFAAHAMGYAASWITEWYAYDRRVLDALGLAPNERIAGFVHIGRPAKPPEDRERPNLDAIVTRFEG